MVRTTYWGGYIDLCKKESKELSFSKGDNKSTYYMSCLYVGSLSPQVSVCAAMLIFCTRVCSLRCGLEHTELIMAWIQWKKEDCAGSMMDPGTCNAVKRRSWIFSPEFRSQVNPTNAYNLSIQDIRRVPAGQRLPFEIYSGRITRV
jgi:hypothetical protein